MKHYTVLVFLSLERDLFPILDVLVVQSRNNKMYI